MKRIKTFEVNIPNSDVEEIVEEEGYLIGKRGGWFERETKVYLLPRYNPPIKVEVKDKSWVEGEVFFSNPLNFVHFLTEIKIEYFPENEDAVNEFVKKIKSYKPQTK